MFQGLRLNLTGKFLLLSLLVYIVLSLTSAVFFRTGLTQSLDEELREIWALVSRAVVIGEDELPHLSNSPKQLSLRDNVVMPTVAIFDGKQQLLIQKGVGSDILLPSGTEQDYGKTHLRSYSKEISRGGKTMGYIQIQLNTSARENAVTEYLEAIAATTPILLIALAGAGYIFASRAIKPVEESFDLLKRFMSDAGHELKTPIAVIHATCDNLAADLEENSAAAERVEVISRS
ncbi:MAG: hypothetical protein K2X27_07725, partial [Candidatus Obscuribacterales bacterium]|nr:hypothetical protein [Candidatus Obscuribacterales bacterium]